MPELEEDLFAGDDGAEDTGDDGGDASSTGTPDQKSTDKRVRDLQSKADQETARANKAETKLNAMLAAVKDPEVGKPDDTGNAVGEAILDMARMFAVQQNPKLAEYGLSASDLGGGTPREVARVAAELVSRYEKMETQIRNKVLADNGLSPEVGGEKVQTGGSRDFSKMSSEDFAKFQAEVMKGQR